ncbi:mandelamide hydrolase-like [Asterias rubens]|uniref:mandelamide hydrolase-like n=1 Tax=Asterias rubens TaxID=7604 RepID=UPI0014554F0E|nr:mandelamide hydrolase-like [Asterias rubens]
MYRLTIGDLLDRFKKGTLTCEAYTKRMIQRAEDLVIFNYFVSMDTERMLQKAKEADARYQSKTNRPLEGILIALKDNIDVEGEATGACTPGLAGLKPKHTAEVAKRLFDAGAIHAGRTNMHELAFGISTINTYTGSCHNFHNFDYTCGGSSGGSAGAVAANIVPAALGTDTGGSVRIPASYSGVFGLRPTIGRWPADYGVKLTDLKDSVGPLARSADDIAILDHVMTGEAPHEELPPAKIRIGVARPYYWENLDPEVEGHAERFLKDLKQEGFVVVDRGEIPGLGEMFDKFHYPTLEHEVLPRLDEYLKHHNHEVTVAEVIEKIASPQVKAYFQDMVRTCPSDVTIQAAMVARNKLRGHMRAYFDTNQLDCIIMPANKIPPPTLDTFRDNNSNLRKQIVLNNDSGSICNNPSLVIPGGRVRGSGVPFGMQIEGLTGNDRRLIAVARAIEKALKL